MKKIVYDKTFFDNSFSTARMKPYYERYPGNERKALQHYRQNIQLAEALLPSLSIYEVALRNSIIRELERMTGRKDWYAFFLTIQALKALVDQVDIAKQHINMPKTKRQRKYISAPLNDIRALRNRVFHNESISWSLMRLESIHKSILEVCSWINPALPYWIKTVERFDNVILSVKLRWYGWWKLVL